MEDNQQAYSAKEVVAKYVANLRLEKSEVYLFDKYGSYIDGRRVLDIGIGGGRTTYHLSKRAEEYIGLDFSSEFVKYCSNTYANGTSVKIAWADARDLSAYPAAYFDFILFSFNGIDYVTHDERNRILKEFKRVLAPDGILCFSFHNSRNIDKLYSFQMPKNPFKYLGEWRRTQKLVEVNGPKEEYKDKDHFMIYDGGENFTANTFYIKPEFQRSELEKLGYTVVEFCESISGKDLDNASLELSTTPWIYVTCKKSS